MKEIGTFKIDKNMCSNCREDENCPQKYSVNGNCLHIEKDLEIEQVPEDFEELKELCKDIKCCYVGENYISVSERNISFLNDGQIRCNCYNITNKATPKQMWQIIKSLIGE